MRTPLPGGHRSCRAGRSRGEAGSPTPAPTDGRARSLRPWSRRWRRSRASRATGLRGLPHGEPRASNPGFASTAATAASSSSPTRRPAASRLRMSSGTAHEGGGRHRGRFHERDGATASRRHGSTTSASREPRQEVVGRDSSPVREAFVDLTLVLGRPDLRECVTAAEIAPYTLRVGPWWAPGSIRAASAREESSRQGTGALYLS